MGTPMTSPTGRRTSRDPARTPVPLIGLLVLALIVGITAVALGRTGTAPGQPDRDGVVTIELIEHRFVPDQLELPTGEALTLVLHNRGDAAHHVSLGREVVATEGPDAGFGEDLLAGVTLRVDPSRARLTGTPVTTIDVQPGETVTVTFTLPPERAGTWELGCFTGRGCHHRAGMHGTIEVG